MKKLISVLSLLLTASSFAHADSSQIEKVIDAYEQALNGNDTQAIMQLYGESPTFMPQHAPAQLGRQAVKAAYENVFKAIDLDIKFTTHEIEVFGNTAWARTSSAGNTKILANDAVVTEGNNELFVFKNENGHWKIHQYLFSTNQPRQ